MADRGLWGKQEWSAAAPTIAPSPSVPSPSPPAPPEPETTAGAPAPYSLRPTLMLRAPGRTRRARHWLAHHRVSLAVVAVLLGVVALVHGVGMNASPSPVDDEGTYVAQAWAVVARHSLTPYTYWYDHPPLGWLIIGAWAWLTHGFTPLHSALSVGRQVALVAQLVSVPLLYGIARRLDLGRSWSAAAVLLWTLSPLDVSYGRMAYLDNLAVPLLLASLLLALSPRRSLWAMCGSGLAFAAAVLTKETMLVFLPMLLWQAWQQSDRRTRAFCLTGLLAGFGLVAVIYPLYALLKGELLPGAGHVSLGQAIVFQLGSRQSSGSPWAAHSPARLLIDSWLSEDFWVIAIGLVGLPVALAVRRLRPVGIGLLMAVAISLRGGYLPQPYVIALLPLAALVGTGALQWTWRVVPEWLSSRAAARRGAGGEVPGRTAPAQWRRRAQLGLGAVVALAALIAVPHWASADRTDMTSDSWQPYRAAEAWVETNVARTDRLLVDDTMWVDFEQHGFDRHLNVVWFSKLGSSNNLDPSVERSLPGGWRDFDYVVLTSSIRASIAQDPSGQGEVIDAIRHSKVVATFGTGGDQVTIQRISSGRSQT